MWLLATDQVPASAWFVSGQRDLPALDAAPSNAGHPLLRQACDQCQACFRAALTRFDLPLDPRSGSPFEQPVWTALRAIPHGCRAGYGDVARLLGLPGASRAVGGAAERHPVSLIIPCHRVTDGRGAATGYDRGLGRKVALLDLDGRQSRLFPLPTDAYGPPP